MPTHLAFLRGINVGGKALVPMADLRKLLESLGHTDVATLLQSGNAVLTSKKKPATIESELERALQAKYKRDISVLVRTAADWHALLAANPFPDFAAKDPSHLVVMCFKSAPTPAHLAALRDAYSGPEQFALARGAVFFTYPESIGTSKLTNAVIERHLGSAGTARNWSTANKIAALL